MWSKDKCGAGRRVWGPWVPGAWGSWWNVARRGCGPQGLFPAAALLQALLRALPKEREETLQEAERWREGINHHRKHANAFK